jgi:transcriptional regulator with XRE-family HTH domain
VLARLRVQAGLSQNALARRSEIDPAYVNRIERVSGAEAPRVSRGIVLTMALVLGLDDADTDRLLYAAGLAPVLDYQTMAEEYARRLEQVAAALEGIGTGQVTRNLTVH